MREYLKNLIVDQEIELLKTLNIKNSRNVLVKNGHICELEYSGDNIKSNLSIFPELEVFRISKSSNFSDVLEWLGRHPKLRVFEATKMNLKEIPSKLFLLKNIEELNLGENQLTSLPPEMGKLKQLKVLKVNGNALKKLPLELGTLVNLIHLNVSKNKLNSIPKCIEKFKNLEYLDVSFNKIISIPEFLEDLPKLKTLHINNNGIFSFPSIYRKLTKQTELYFQAFERTPLPDWFFEWLEASSVNKIIFKIPN